MSVGGGRVIGVAFNKTPSCCLSCHHMSSYIWSAGRVRFPFQTSDSPPLTSKQNKKPNDLGSPRPLGYLASVPRFIFTTDQRGTEISDGNVATRHFALCFNICRFGKNSDKSKWSACNIKEAKFSGSVGTESLSSRNSRSRMAGVSLTSYTLESCK